MSLFYGSPADSMKLFYSKRSQFVSGVEAEKVSVSVGQRVSLSMDDRICSRY